MFVKTMRDRCALVALLYGWLMLTGCSTYAVAPQGADMALFGVVDEQARAEQTDWGVRDALALQPLARFPTAIAVARVQSAAYSSRSHGVSYGRGAYTVVTTRTVEQDADFAKVGQLEHVTGVAPLNRLLLASNLRSDAELRTAAARLHADLLLIYTFDTAVFSGDSDSPLDVVTLGFLPGKEARVVTTASAVLMGTHNGYIYATAEATSETSHRANTWTSERKVDEARFATEAEAFGELIDAFVSAWPGVAQHYANAAE
ncbi:MAG: hypothetical protein ACIAXF_15535 [Phycisphaerales bacterium JB063]